MRRQRVVLRAAVFLVAAAVIGSSSAWGQNSGFRGRLIDTTFAPGNTVGAVNLANDLAAYAAAGTVQADIFQRIPSADLFGSVAGLYSANNPYPGGAAVPGNGNNFVVELFANVTIPAGNWTITFGSDDGGMLQIPGVTFSSSTNEGGKPAAFGSDTLWFNNPRGQAWTGGSFTVPAGGLSTTLRHVFYENGGGDLTEVAIINQLNPGTVTPVPATWALLADGAMGWSVKTDATDTAQRYVGGRGVTGVQVVPTTVIPTEFTREDPPVPGLFMEVFLGAPRNSQGSWNALLGTLPTPAASGIVEQINWDEGGDLDGYLFAQPIVDAFDPLADPLNSNFSNYSTRLTGEILIPQNGAIQFKDGNDDYTYFAVDTDGNGTMEVLIDDNGWTQWDGGSANGGSPIVSGTFSNVGAGGSWRKMEFRMAEGGGDDNAALFWDQNPLGLFPLVRTDPATRDDLVPPENFRTNAEQIVRADVEGRFTGGIFDIDVAEIEWDRLAVTAPLSNKIDNLRLNIDGAEFAINVIGNITPGFTADLILLGNVTEVVGTPTFNFLNTNAAEWDISSFAVNGQITYVGGGGGINGDYNNSGQVEQGDLDLVLLNWGNALNAPWVTGIVDQAELDTVLLNWGNVAALGGAAGVPEPSTVTLVLLVAVGFGLNLIRRRAGVGGVMNRNNLFRTVMVALAVAVLASSSALAQNPGFRGRLVDTTFAPGDTVGALNILDNLAAVAGPGTIQADIEQRIVVADLFGNVGGLFGRNHPYPGNIQVPGNGNDFTVELTANVVIPAGNWTITFGSDDGGMIQIPGVNFMNRQNENGRPAGLGNDTIWFNAPRGQGWTSGEFTVPAGGLNTTFRHVFYENGGGDVTEVAIINALGQSNVPDAATWALLEDGAMGWQVKTSATDTPLTNVSGRGIIGTQLLSGDFVATEVTTQPVQPGAYFRVFVGPNLNSSGAWTSHLAGFPSPNAVGVEEQIVWSNNGNDVLGIGYNDTLIRAFGIDPVNQIAHNQENYSVQVTGEIRVPGNGEVFFKDSNDDYTYLAVDQNGDGVIRSNEVVIDDNTWTGNDGTENGGSPIAMANFTGVAAGGSWRKYEFRMAEGGGGDNGGLFWDQAPGAIFPFVRTDPLTDFELVQPDQLRTNQEEIVKGEIVAKFGGGNFEVDVEELQWDKVTMLRPLSAPPGVIDAVKLDINGSTFSIEVIRGDLTPGFTIDLINNRNIDEVTGTPTFNFVNSNAADWDTSSFLANGQLTFQAAAALAGDYNANGRVEQGDLDLVLLNWGADGSEAPGGWVSNMPTGLIDQSELDAVLLNWGAALPLGGGVGGVPEPSTFVLLLLAVAGFSLIRRR